VKFVQPIRDKVEIERLKKVLRNKSERNWMIFVAGINTGLRISDLLQLRVRDVKNKTRIEVKEGKTKKTKLVPVSAPMRGLFNRYVQGKDGRVFLFPSRKGANIPLGRSGAYSVLTLAALKVGLPGIGTHSLRKTFGYHMYKKNKNVAILMELFNHSHPSVTMRYIGVNQDDLDAAVGDLGLL
jgi:integrase